LLPVLLDLRPIADGSVCPSVKGVFPTQENEGSFQIL